VLELKWELPQSIFPGFYIDKAYPFALGLFYNTVKGDFGFKEELDSLKAPEGMLPYIVQYRFRKKPNSWPALQFGPGIATINFTSAYAWELFKDKALYLQKVFIDCHKTDLVKCVPPGINPQPPRFLVRIDGMIFELRLRSRLRLRSKIHHSLRQRQR